uniref:Uncharacterized protein n=1 Tax=Panagrellus redivivus TaxID=6233 RepID=A0A7E4ZT73_PANRE
MYLHHLSDRALRRPSVLLMKDYYRRIKERRQTTSRAANHTSKTDENRIEHGAGAMITISLRSVTDAAADTARIGH